MHTETKTKEREENIRKDKKQYRLNTCRDTNQGNTDKIHAEIQTKKIQTKYMPRPQQRKRHHPLAFVPAH